MVVLAWLAWWLPRQIELKGFAFLDVLVRGACLALAVGWMAPLLAGDDFGKVTTAAWGIPVAKLFEDGTPVVAWASQPANDAVLRQIHPTQIYEALFALGLFFVLGFVGKRAKATGRVTALFLMLYAVGRAALDLFRGDAGPAPRIADRGFVIADTLSWTQFLAIPIFFAGPRDLADPQALRRPLGLIHAPRGPGPRVARSGGSANGRRSMTGGSPADLPASMTRADPPFGAGRLDWRTVPRSDPP